MSVIDDILDDEKEFYLETDDKMKLYGWNFISWGIWLPFIFAIIYLVNLQGLNSYIEAFGLSFFISMFGMVIYVASTTLRFIIFEKYKKLYIDKNGDFIFITKNEHSEKIKVNSIKTITIKKVLLVAMRKIMFINLRYKDIVYQIKIINKYGKKYQITVSDIGGFPTDDELPCKIEYNDVSNLPIPKNLFLIMPAVIILFTFVFYMFFHQ